MITLHKRGKQYHVSCTVSGSRVRAALGTTDKQSADKIKTLLGTGLISGRSSSVWGDLKRILPQKTYAKFAVVSGLPSNPNPTWGDLLRAYEKDCRDRIERKELSPNTFERYTYVCDAFTDFCLGLGGQTRLEDITPDVINQFKTWRLRRIQSSRFHRGGTGISLDCVVLRAVFRLAVEKSWIEKNPVRTNGSPGDKPARMVSPLSGEQLISLRRACDSSNLLPYLIFRHTGFRGSDVADLKWSHVHLADKEIVKETIKRKKTVYVPIHEELEEVLAKTPHTSEYVLGRPYTRPELSLIMKKLAKKVNIQGFHNHRFRATLAVDLLLRGANPYDIAKILGDNLKTIEKVYLSFAPSVRKKLAETLNNKGLEDFVVMEKTHAL